jgi:hypothetical protein
MKQIVLGFLVIAGIGVMFSCSDNSPQKKINPKKVTQRDDGTISLGLDKADRYTDMEERTVNTAEWNVVVRRSGRYDVWISSATLDTTSLNYKNSVMVCVQDKMIQALPDCDKIITNSRDVSHPYFRADSFIGTLYLKDTGEFYIQVTSEMILPEDYNIGETSAAEIAKLISVSFTPVTR